MKSAGQLLLGLIAAVGSSLLVLSAASLSLVEGGMQKAMLPSPIPVLASPTGATLTLPAMTPVPQTPTQAQPTACPTPEGWAPYTVQPGDTLESIAEQAGVSVEQIKKANCLSGASLFPNTLLYLPFAEPTATAPALLPTAQLTATATANPTATIIACGPPPGWVAYYVRPGDTLFRLSLDLGVSMYQLQTANCLTGTQINAGQRLWVPFIPAPRPVATSTPTLEPLPTDTTEPPTEAPTEAPTTAVPTNTVEPTATTAPTDTAVPPTETPVTPSPTTAAPSSTPGAVEVGTVTPQTTPGQ